MPKPPSARVRPAGDQGGGEALRGPEVVVVVPSRPVGVLTAGDEAVCIVLNYGEQSDWVRNVITAGSAGLVDRRIRYAFTKPRVLDASSAELPGAVRAIGGPGRRVLHATLTPA
jgi:hypothetical protein